LAAASNASKSKIGSRPEYRARIRSLSASRFALSSVRGTSIDKQTSDAGSPVIITREQWNGHVNERDARKSSLQIGNRLRVRLEHLVNVSVFLNVPEAELQGRHIDRVAKTTLERLTKPANL
jgi:hypothetical protein